MQTDRHMQTHGYTDSFTVATQGRSQDFEEGGAITTKEGAKRRNLVDQKPHLLLIIK